MYERSSGFESLTNDKGNCVNQFALHNRPKQGGDVMRLRTFAALGALCVLSACSEPRASREDLESQVDDLASTVELLEMQLREARDSAETLKTEVSDLDSTVDRLTYEDWQTVAPDIISARDDVVRAQEAVSTAVEER